MKTHVKTVHKKRKPYKCENCGKSSAQKINMKMHLKNHHTSKKVSGKFRCMQCEYSCGFKALLTHVEKYHKLQLNEGDKKSLTDFTKNVEMENGVKIPVRKAARKYCRLVLKRLTSHEINQKSEIRRNAKKARPF